MQAIQIRGFIFLVALALFVPAALAEDGDAEAGERVFRRCTACHSFDPVSSKMGPHLSGIWGRKAAAVDDFAYSGVMQRSGIVWSEASLRAYVSDPQGFLPGSTMMVGVSQRKDLTDVLAYLRAQSAQEGQ